MIVDGDLLERLFHAVREAGNAILAVHNAPILDVERKEDDSPLTQADRASHEILDAALAELTPEIPRISEEGRMIPFETRTTWARFWCIDPLDGTKEFIRREKDFTVNVALVEGGVPVLGIVYAPARDWLYVGSPVTGAWKEGEGGRQRLPLEHPPRDGLVAVRSKSHADPAEDALLERLGITDTRLMGSSLKFCLVAEGTADIYYRKGPTWEWDTAAAHAVVRAAGGRVCVHGEELTYNKPSLKNEEGFLCLQDGALLARIPSRFHGGCTE